MNFLRDDIIQLNHKDANAPDLEQTLQRTRIDYSGRRTISWNEMNGDVTAVYIVEAKGDADYWLGMSDNGPGVDIISALDGGVKQKIRDKELMLVIVAADNPFNPSIQEAHLDIIYKAMADYNLPPGSVAISVENNDLTVYNSYAKANGRMIQMFTGTNRDRFEIVRDEPSVEKAINLQFSRDFNSLNKSTMHNPHIAYHCYMLLQNNFLKRGIVSLNYFEDERNGDRPGMMHAYFPPLKDEAWNELMPKYYPRHVDFQPDEYHYSPDYNEIPYDVFDASLLTFVNETHINKSIILSEKIYKPIRAGHPFIYMGDAGALAQLRQNGYATDFLDIDTSYDDIEEEVERAIAVNTQLTKWIHRPRAEKIELIREAMPELKRNMQVQPMHDRLLNETVKQARKYFK
jgi:hypothetical protein